MRFETSSGSSQAARYMFLACGGGRRALRLSSKWALMHAGALHFGLPRPAEPAGAALAHPDSDHPRDRVLLVGGCGGGDVVRERAVQCHRDIQPLPRKVPAPGADMPSGHYGDTVRAA